MIKLVLNHENKCLVEKALANLKGETIQNMVFAQRARLSGAYKYYLDLVERISILESVLSDEEEHLY